jgi:hypothetical protein
MSQPDYEAEMIGSHRKYGSRPVKLHRAAPGVRTDKELTSSLTDFMMVKASVLIFAAL